MAPKNNNINLIKDEIRLLTKLEKQRGFLTEFQKEEVKVLKSKLNLFLKIEKSSNRQLENQKNITSLGSEILHNTLSNTKSAAILGKHAHTQLDIEIQILKNSKNIGKDKFKQVDLAEQEKELAEDILNIQENWRGKNITLGKSVITNLKLRYKTQKEIADIQQTAHDITEEANEAFNEIFQVEKLKKFTTALKSPEGKLAQMKLSALALGAAIIKTAKDMLSFANETGFSYIQILKLGPAVAFLGEEANAILQEFGGISNITTKQLITMKLLNFQYGISAESQVKVLGLMESISGQTREQLMHTIRLNAKLARKAGVSGVMEDVANNTEFFAQFAKDGGDNIIKAAISARKLGLELSTIATITDSILDFESSIEKEMEAELLLGRHLNLDRARQLAFTGDQVGLMTEIKNLVGSEVEFNAMNVVQRKALSEAIGISVADMSKLIREQKKSLGFAQQFKASWIGIGAAIGAVIGVIVGGLTLGAGLPAMAAGMLKGAGLGAGIGAGIGTLAAGALAVNDIAIPPGGATAITGPAGTFTLNKKDTVVAGTSLQNNTDMKETNSKLGQLIAINKALMEQNGVLLTKLNRSINNVGSI